MIRSVLLRALRNGEFIHFCKNVLTICRDNDPSALSIEGPLLALQRAMEPLDEHFAQERGNTITAELELLDKRRDAALIGLRCWAEGGSYHFDTAFAAAGKQLLEAFDKYGHNLTKLNYHAKTEMIENLTGELDNDAELHTAVGILRLEEWVNELCLANSLFNTRYLHRNSDYAAQPVINLYPLREQAIDAWQQLARHITAHATLHPSDAYTKLINEINTLAGEYNLLVTNRRKGLEDVLKSA